MVDALHVTSGVLEVMGRFPGGGIVAQPYHQVLGSAMAGVAVQYFLECPFFIACNFDRGVRGNCLPEYWVRGGGF